MKYRVWDTEKSDRGIGVGETVEAGSAHEALKAWGKRKGCAVEYWTKHDPETGGTRYAAATMRDRMGRRVKMGARMAMW
jgi:hypothetical protein